MARNHAIQLIEVEKRWHIFWELPIQQFFMSYPRLMIGINWLYSFIHIPGTIAFLVWLFYYTITNNKLDRYSGASNACQAQGSPSGPALYEARRRTMAVCNLLAFVVFTLWPCMPPRLLSDPVYHGHQARLAKSYGFVDTVHGQEGASSVWTQNRFCNQYGRLLHLCSGSGAHIPSCDAVTPLRLLADDRSDDYDNTSSAPASKNDTSPPTLLQSKPP